MSFSSRLLRRFHSRLESSLQGCDILKLSQDLQKGRVFSEDLIDKLATLDSNLEPEVKVRYLLQQVHERVRKDDKVYARLIKVLIRLGGEVESLCRDMGKEVEQVRECIASEGGGNDIVLVEQDVSYLVEVLVSCSSLWEEIGIALKLPRLKLSFNEDKTNISKLNSILTTWILGNYDRARCATFNALKEALASDLVNERVLAHNLKLKRDYVDPLPDTETSSLDMDIVYQSCKSEVAEGASTLLEVQVSSGGVESYQWSKDGQSLSDGADFSGVSTNMLFINRANSSTGGKYSCCVSQGSETQWSDEINLSVIYPPEKQQLLEFYLDKEKEEPPDSWPPVSNSTFVNLVLVKQKPMSSTDYYTIRGDIDDILESKEVVEYEEVFREYKEGALVLVEGRPGSGKTTLVRKLTGDWAAGKNVLKGAKIVFLVTLRELNVFRKDKSLLDILQIFYGEDLSKTIEYDLQNSKGMGACFILDGLDEYPIEAKKAFVIGQLLFSKAFLFKSMVIVASRPVATRKLKARKPTCVEVVGFSVDQIYRYVRAYPFNDSSTCEFCEVTDVIDCHFMNQHNYFKCYLPKVYKFMSNCMVTISSTCSVCKMTEFLKRHPNVLYMCYLPVHASMICFLFNQLGGNIPHRETQIYEQFTIATLLKHKAREELKRRTGEEQEIQLKSLKDLCGEEKELFSSICELAFNMTVKSQQVVSKSDVTSVSLFTDSLLCLLTVERTSKHYGSEDLYTFSHLTLQEFLAAFHIREARLDDEMLIKEHSFKNVWRFYSGLVETNTHVKFVETVFEKCTFDFLFKVQCAYESQQVELCDYVVKNEDISLSGTSTDLIALGYVICKSSKLIDQISLEYCMWDIEIAKSFFSMATESKLQSIKCLKVKHDGDFEALKFLLIHLPFLEQLEMIQVKLDKARVESLTGEVILTRLNSLKISFPSPPCSNPEEILRLLTFGSKNVSRIFYSISDLLDMEEVVGHEICRNAFGYSMIQDCYKSWLYLYNLKNCPLSHERLSHCIVVVLVNCCIGDDGAKTLANSLNPSILEKLVLDFNRIGNPGAVALAGCLARCDAVREISIKCNSIGDPGAVALASALVNCKSLLLLDLQGNSLGDEGAIAIAKGTKSLYKLVLYLHNVNITEEGMEEVLNYRAWTRIRSMQFFSSWNVVSEADIDTLRNALHSGNLPALSITPANIHNIRQVTEQEQVRDIRGIFCDWSVMDDYTVPLLCTIIKRFLPTLNHFDFTFGKSFSFSHTGLSDCLKTCKSLHSLDLKSGNLSSSFSSSSLLSMVKCCTLPNALKFYFVELGSDRVSQLFENHESLINLHTLRLYQCSIGLLGALALGKVLRHCKKLQCFDLSVDYIGDDGAKAIAEGLKDHTCLTELYLNTIGMTIKGMASVGHIVKHNRLHYLNLGTNFLRHIGSLLAVFYGSVLRVLNLNDTELGAFGMQCLCYGLTTMTQLVRLNVGGNDIGSKGVFHLAEGLKSCTDLKDLIVRNNGITSEGVDSIVRIMKICPYLRNLELQQNCINMDDAAALVSGWKYKHLLRLRLSECFGEPHESALHNGDKCCSRCDNLLKVYYNNDCVRIEMSSYSLPKLLS